MKKRPPSLDLHGFSASEAENTLLQFLSDSIVAGANAVHIIHGHGTGKIQGVVERVLSDTDAVARFSISPQNRGMTIAYLRESHGKIKR